MNLDRAIELGRDLRAMSHLGRMTPRALAIVLLTQEVLRLRRERSEPGRDERTLIGFQVETRIVDGDEGPDGERLIPVGTRGVIEGADEEAGLLDIHWTNGAWTRWTPVELVRDADVVRGSHD